IPESTVLVLAADPPPRRLRERLLRNGDAGAFARGEAEQRVRRVRIVADLRWRAAGRGTVGPLAVRELRRREEARALLEARAQIGGGEALERARAQRGAIGPDGRRLEEMRQERGDVGVAPLEPGRNPGEEHELVGEESGVPEEAVPALAPQVRAAAQHRETD